MYPKYFLFIFLCTTPSWLFSQVDTTDCNALNEIVRMVSTKKIRESDGNILDSTATQKNYVLKYHLVDLDDVEELSTTQYSTSSKVSHIERFFAHENLATQLAFFEKKVQQISQCIPEWDKTTLQDRSGKKGYLYKVLFTNFEDETTVSIQFLEINNTLYTTQLQIFN